MTEYTFARLEDVDATAAQAAADAAAASAVIAQAAQAAAETAETNAETAATNAATSETNAADSAALAMAWAINPEDDDVPGYPGEFSALHWAMKSQDYAQQAAVSFDELTDIYLGAHATAPTQTDDGDPLEAGMLYYNTVTELLYVYDGASWQAATGITQVSDDTSPTLGGSLDGGGFDITNVDDITCDTLQVTDDAYGAGWNGSTLVPTRNAVYDKIELVLGTTLPATYQPLNTANLSAIAALTTTAYGRGLLELADAAAVRTYTNSVIGTNVQAWDADLDAIAALSPSDDDIVQRKAGAWTNRTMAQLIADLGALGTTFQPLDSDLTSWAGVTRASGFDTFAATPSLANLGSLLTNEAAGAMTFLTTPTVANLMALLTDDASGLGTFMTTPSSANFAALLTDETGTGVVYFTGGALGTPSSGTGTNLTGIPLTGLVSDTTTALGIGSINLGHASDTTLTRSAAGKLAVEGSDALLVSGNAHKKAITIVIDGGGSVITTGVKGEWRVPWACTITKNTVLLDQSGSIVVDLWVDTYANYPPTVADTITASAKPTVSSTTKSEDSTLTGWTTSIAAGSTLRWNVDSISTALRANVILEVTLTQ